MSLARYLANLLNSSGQVPDAKLVALAASKLTGQVPDANAPSGSVIQVVSATTTTTFTSTSTTYADIGLQATITPTSASNRVLILASFGDTSSQNQGSPAGNKLVLFRNATQVGGQLANQWNYTGANIHTITSGGIVFVDSPNSTSALTYKFRGATQTDGRTMEFMRDSTTGSIILMEIAA